ncbi:MAG TPA: CoB--CoM heterodisulfide reductase iron-sulfur subunit A family protein, partial [Thermodesulfatator atlanticus]|nr:CoB--CoM heterodisulfide reductase iron-sulfur subunit A family protein [Thermodesulfatator atlanticus]
MGKGAVLVVGGGVAGVQAALDLAAGGFYVHLVEQGPAIGGVMAQLDKTFPTNDCSMCILSPKLVEVGRELNINLLTLSEILEISGEPGDFRVRIRKHPRYVDEDKCIACGQCAAKCPKQVPNEFDRGLSKRKA